MTTTAVFYYDPLRRVDRRLMVMVMMRLGGKHMVFGRQDILYRNMTSS